MKRKEAKRLFDKCNSDFVIDKIYDYFESKTCENCNYYTGTICYYHEGWNDDVGVVHPNMNKNDGCIKFERK